MKKVFNTNKNDFLTIWFNKEKKEEYFEVVRLELGDMVTVNLDKNKLYNIITRLPNKSIKKYKLKDKEISKSIKKRPYVEKVGLMLINFLNTDFLDFDKSFDSFYSIYGYEFLYKYSKYMIVKLEYEYWNGLIKINLRNTCLLKEFNRVFCVYNTKFDFCCQHVLILKNTIGKGIVILIMF